MVRCMTHSIDYHLCRHIMVGSMMKCDMPMISRAGGFYFPMQSGSTETLLPGAL